jgi:hypothetical protein
MKVNETLNKAYGNVPKEVGINFNMLSFIPARGIKYYWLILVRKFTR